MRAKNITIAEVEFTAFTLAKELLSGNEPIPDFGTRFPKILESCLEAPFGRFDRKDLYRGMIGKASVLFYFMIKNHPFQNGNKRIAVMSLLVFLANNGKWLDIYNTDLYDLAVNVAQSEPKERKEIIQNIYFIIQKHLVNFSQK